MSRIDYIADRNADDAKNEFITRLVKAKDELVAFVEVRMGWEKLGKAHQFFRGSFNISLVVENMQTFERVLIRFPLRGSVYGPWRDEKVKNEVMALQYISEKTNIPVPQVYHWGMTEASPMSLGPFIIEEFKEGEDLHGLLKKPTDDEKIGSILDPNIPDPKLDFVYESETDGKWHVVGRPLTYDMNEVATVCGFPVDQFEVTEPFNSASDYFHYRAHCLQTSLMTQRNLWEKDTTIMWNRFIARHCLPKLIPTYLSSENQGPFRLYCDDMRPLNMLADPVSLRITAVVDLEFTNAMPAQYAHDLPWWLTLEEPGISIEEDKEAFLSRFEPRKEQFLGAMERVERKCSPFEPGEQALSARMRDSWNTGRFWFNLASRSTLEVEEIYWKMLHKDGLGEAVLDPAILAEKQAFLKLKRRQIDEYFADKNRDDRS
ncbi:hypothetical protein F5Y18DRAFT_418241 [Xylariaceae sp. FL1019]|nr:hypothetical protein F5Y18DRAFT_418241 [Xylariaceae sp. FL1019]